jgi:methoxymalonate biosynthesis acyl carrier protein
MRQKIYLFLTRYIKNRELKDDDDIFNLGLVNSLFTMQLVMFLENEFHIVIQNEELDWENFKSINSITSFVNKKLEELQE